MGEIGVRLTGTGFESEEAEDMAKKVGFNGKGDQGFSAIAATIERLSGVKFKK